MTRTAITMFLLMIVVIGGDIATSPSAWAEPGNPDHSDCHLIGDRECGPGGPHGPRPDGSCPPGGTPATGGLPGIRTCSYAGGSSSSSSGKRGKKEAPCTPATCSVAPSLDAAPVLPADYRDPSYASNRPGGLSGPGR